MALTSTHKKVGILFPIFSLPGEGGIGDLGSECFRFIDALAEIGANYWQVLPLNLVDKRGCAYASPAAFGGEPMLIDTASLSLPYHEEFHHEIDYESLRERKLEASRIYAKEKLKLKEAQNKILQFKRLYSWAHDLAIFLTLRDAYGDHWNQWPQNLWNIQGAEVEVRERYREDYETHLYLQALFHEQWQRIKEYADLKKIQIIGDIPIFVSATSFDAWRWPDLFKLHPVTKEPLVITGAPPDEFNDEGQLWGTVNYQWDNKDLQMWWLKRLHYCQDLYHLTRIDHFVGLHHVWESAPDATDARLGEYIPSKGRELLTTIRKEFPELPFIAEDLGVLNDDIRKLRHDFGYPTMRVYQFSLEEKGKPLTKKEVNEHMPKNIPEHCFYYSGTHDNNTLRGWLESSLESDYQANQLKERFADRVDRESPHWPDHVREEILKEILSSPANNVIIALQDVFSLGHQARINIPGTTEGNWSWRLSLAQWDQEQWLKLGELFKEHKRGHHAHDL